MSVKCNVTAGTSIREAARDAIHMIGKMGVPVSFDFNGIPVLCWIGDDVDSIVEAYERDCAMIAATIRGTE